MELERILAVEEAVTLGTHEFSADEIKAYAALYDPQPYHLDEEAGRQSVFGALCASGWHTLSIWSRCVVEGQKRASDEMARSGGGVLRFGPGLGVDGVAWRRPVFAGDRITYRRTFISLRSSASTPGRYIGKMYGEGVNADGAVVVTLNVAEMIHLDPAEVRSIV